MKLRYDDLKRIAAEVRAEMAEQGKVPTGTSKTCDHEKIVPHSRMNWIQQVANGSAGCRPRT